MARINLGKVVPEKGVDYYTEEEKAEFKAEIEEDVTALSETVTAQGTAIATLQLDSAHTIEMTLNSATYELTLILKNKAGTALATQTINLPNENALTNISYSNGALTLTKQSGTTIQVDISGLINGLATETALTNLANALKETIGIQTNTYDNTKTYNTGDIVVQNEKIYKANQDNITGTFDSSKWDEISLYEYQKIQDEAIEENYKEITKLQEDVEDLTERMEDAENNQLTNTPEVATSHYLQDSADSRFRKFIPIGRTTQESTTGDNLISSENHNFEYMGVTYKSQDDGTILANGEKYGGAYVVLSGNTITLEEGTYSSKQFLLDGSIKKDGNDVKPTVYLTLEDLSHSYNLGEFGNPGKSQTIPAGTYFIRFAVWNDNVVFTNAKLGVMLVKGSSIPSEFERYTGGEPAPNPIYPYAIKNTGDNGSVNEKVQNKNWLNLVNASGRKNNIDYIVENQSILLNGTGSSGTYSWIIITKDSFIFNNGTPSASQIINWANGKLLTIGQVSKSMQVLSGSTSRSSFSTNVYDENGNAISTFEENTKVIALSIYLGSTETYTNFKFGLQLEQGSTPTSYVPHSEQNISFPLAQGQKLMEGDYLADDGVHHKRNRIVFNGSENWGVSSFAGYYRVQIAIPSAKKFPTNISTALCNSYHYSVDVFNSTLAKLGQFGQNNGTSTFYFMTDKTLAEFKSDLAQKYEDGTPLILEYELAEEQTEDFTEEQKTAWEEIKKARTYKNITHISSEDETPATVEVEYVRDINTIDDRITALEARVDLLEE